MKAIYHHLLPFIFSPMFFQKAVCSMSGTKLTQQACVVLFLWFTTVEVYQSNTHQPSLNMNITINLTDSL